MQSLEKIRSALLAGRRTPLARNWHSGTISDGVTRSGCLKAKATNNLSTLYARGKEMRRVSASEEKCEGSGSEGTQTLLGFENLIPATHEQSSGREAVRVAAQLSEFEWCFQAFLCTWALGLQLERQSDFYLT
jgi:hypothetical protein